MSSYVLLSGLGISLVQLSWRAWIDWRGSSSIKLSASTSNLTVSARSQPDTELEPSGTPVRPKLFWKEIARRKLGLLGLNAALTALACFRLGWDVASRDSDSNPGPEFWVTDVTDLIFAVSFPLLRSSHKYSQSAKYRHIASFSVWPTAGLRNDTGP